MIDSYFDVLIIGTGISGINAAYHIQESLPNVKFTILEARHELGGIWSLFKYPGIRSDSDLHTFGFKFYPWRAKNPIGKGEEILKHLDETARTFDLDKKIWYKHKVTKADWRSTGYYNYDQPLDAEIPGLDNFQGKIVHPQFWPQDLDYKGKNIVIVGSGATAITLLPALVDGGAGSVTQLQRSPSYIMSLNQDDRVWFEKWAPEWFTLRYKRFMSTFIGLVFYKFCVWFPKLARTGKANIVADTIKSVVSDGIELTSGQKLDADIIITATGLNMYGFGGINVTVDGKQVDVPSQYLWRSSMLTSVPNFGTIIGYFNASWTLGAEAASHLYARLIKHQQKHGYTSVVPVISEKEKEKTLTTPQFTSTYLLRAMMAMPRYAMTGPWKPRDSWFVDSWDAKRASLEEGLKWEKVAVE
ncbi:hypothetical protein ACET3X_003905 [Alternaria dauci]|uniref:Uncharacterized protein n=1 Tax=Alternaria dauci TaxID=48095 RepID=A0ABR3UNX5_9PLEO